MRSRAAFGLLTVLVILPFVSALGRGDDKKPEDKKTLAEKALNDLAQELQTVKLNDIEKKVEESNKASERGELFRSHTEYDREASRPTVKYQVYVTSGFGPNSRYHFFDGKLVRVDRVFLLGEDKRPLTDWAKEKKWEKGTLFKALVSGSWGSLKAKFDGDYWRTAYSPALDLEWQNGSWGSDGDRKLIMISLTDTKLASQFEKASQVKK